MSKQTVVKRFNVALITSRYDGFSKQFHQLPGRPIAIIELNNWSAFNKLKRHLRNVLSLVLRKRFYGLWNYSRDQNLSYYAVDWGSKDKIKGILEAEAVDLAVTYSCSIIPMKFLDSLKFGAINIHDSLLPKYRGGDPLFWQVLHGVDETGITIHQLTDDVDTGPILKQVRVKRPIYISEKELSQLLNSIYGFKAVRDVIQDIMDDCLHLKDQPIDKDAPMAPNGARQCWRQLALKMGLDSYAIEDMEYFLGVRGGSSKTSKAMRTL